MLIHSFFVITVVKVTIITSGVPIVIITQLLWPKSILFQKTFFPKNPRKTRTPLFAHSSVHSHFFCEHSSNFVAFSRMFSNFLGNFQNFLEFFRIFQDFSKFSIIFWKMYRSFRKVVATLKRSVATNRNVVTAKSAHNISNPVLGQKCYCRFLPK